MPFFVGEVETYPLEGVEVGGRCRSRALRQSTCGSTARGRRLFGDPLSAQFGVRVNFASASPSPIRGRADAAGPDTCPSDACRRALPEAHRT